MSTTNRREVEDPSQKVKVVKMATWDTWHHNHPTFTWFQAPINTPKAKQVSLRKTLAIRIPSLLFLIPYIDSHAGGKTEEKASLAFFR